jgi:hypothetical protein
MNMHVFGIFFFHSCDGGDDDVDKISCFIIRELCVEKMNYLSVEIFYFLMKIFIFEGESN